MQLTCLHCIAATLSAHGYPVCPPGHVTIFSAVWAQPPRWPSPGLSFKHDACVRLQQGLPGKMRPGCATTPGWPCNCPRAVSNNPSTPSEAVWEKDVNESAGPSNARASWRFGSWHIEHGGRDDQLQLFAFATAANRKYCTSAFDCSPFRIGG